MLSYLLKKNLRNCFIFCANAIEIFATFWYDNKQVKKECKNRRFTLVKRNGFTDLKTAWLTQIQSKLRPKRQEETTYG